ncbi:solute carrier family 25 member 44 [Cajanus cajan]|uniref:Solute carrier family 25 member 44 n=1 Tax=Cajanus cajan TaxID=3821 RepID=A0A151R4Y2_CAJCA|nr:solute carrier family 25 member 44 [Cajanus cajan]KYP37589.1 Solute carrier family 25 member 44 [Cajanus cajan]
MSLGAAAEEDSASEIQLPAEIDWHMLDKSKFFFLGAALFSGVSFALYPMVVLKTRQQVSSARYTCLHMASAILRHEGLRGFYKGFGTSLMGTIPARALYMASLEVTKSNVATAFVQLGFSHTTALAAASAAAGVTSAMAAQLVWTPIDVVSQRLMVQGSGGSQTVLANLNSESYRNGFDAFRKIMYADGARGFYRGFGISILTYAPSNAVWWTSYSMVHRLIWGAFGSYMGKTGHDALGSGFRPDSRAMVAVQGFSAVLASGVSAIVTMPLDTIKTRLQVLDTEENGRKRPLTFVQTVRSLVKEGVLDNSCKGDMFIRIERNKNCSCIFVPPFFSIRYVFL